MSQHLVSWIQVVGLIVGLYGFFFLSISTFGTSSTPWFRSLLPASGAGIGVLVALSISSQLAPFNIPDLATWAAASVTYIVTYLVAVRLSTSTRVTALRIGTEFTVVSSVLVVAVLMLVMTIRLAFGSQKPSFPETVKVVIASYGIILVGVALMSAVRVIQVFTEDRLKRVGFFLSAVAILTQFLPPMLDVLNIPITKP